MGRSKFPGKPSKHIHRKRVNVLPSTEVLTNIAHGGSVTVNSSNENKQEDGVEVNTEENVTTSKETKVIRKRLPQKLNTSIRKTGRNRGFISNLRNKNSLKVSRSTRNSPMTKTLRRRDSTNLTGKFILPTRSVHSSRVIKPNKRFIDLNESLTVKKKVILKRAVNSDFQEHTIGNDIKDNKTESKCSENDKLAFSNGHRVILRQARLKLPIQTGTQGPFSTKLHNGPGTIICGVCGAVRYYRFVKQARKFNIYSCESCRKFISKQIKKQNVSGSKNQNNILSCHKGQGTCYVPPVVRNQLWKITKCAYRSRCPACWLKMCLRAFHLPPNLKQNLTQLLPKNMRGLDFAFNSTLPPLLWQNNIDNVALVSDDNNCKVDTAVKQRPVRFKNKKSQITTSVNSDIKRQKIDLKGPRVKHVCRSASIVLGQPIATFSNEEKKCDTVDIVVDSKSSAGANKSDIAIIKNEIDNSVSDETAEPTIKRDKSMSSPFPNSVESKSHHSKERSVQNGIYLDYSGDLNHAYNLKYGFSIIGTKKMSINSICFLCGSGGRDTLLICSVCCEPYHDFCVEKTHAIPPKNVDLKDNEWICMKCSKCFDCNTIDRTKIGCSKCLKVFHPECFNPRWETNIHGKPSFCKYCSNCNDCGTALNLVTIPGNIPLCLNCISKKKNTMECPICQNSYQDNNCLNSKVLECITCQKWVHANCENLTAEQYDLIRILPKSSHFICSCCSKEVSPAWKHAVLLEMRSCFSHILWQLSRNKSARNLLKWKCTNKTTHLKYMASTRRINSFLAIDNNNLSKDTPDINKIYSFEENEKLQNDEKSIKTLLDIKSTIQEYCSVKQFYIDIQESLKLAQSDNLLSIFKNIFQSIFPWFSSYHEQAEITTCLESNYECNLSAKLFNEYLPSLPDDTRLCVLCNKVGDGLPHEESRLLYCGCDCWIHLNCAYWSSDVYEEIDNHLQNVHSVIEKSKLLLCTGCKQTGASLQCLTCKNENFHFLCAKKANYVFTKYNKACFCEKHPPTGVMEKKYMLKNDADFYINRSIYIEHKENYRHAAEIENVTCVVGSLSVSSLGKIEPILSDSPDALIPMGFVCSRLFWSTVEPWKLVPYIITTSIENPNCSTLTVDKNFTIDHTLDKIEVDNVLKALCIWQKDNYKRPDEAAETEDDEEKNSADLLSPELTDTILEDLPHDILDGISVQDIFPNFSYDDMLSLENSNNESLVDSFNKKSEEDDNNPQSVNFYNKEVIGSKSFEIIQLSKVVDQSKSRPTQSQRSCSLTLSCKLDSTLSPTVKKRKIATRNNSMYYQLLQVDGNCDESSSSECESPTGISPSNIWENYAPEDQGPVTCEKCQRTYRTQASYKRHLDTCEFICSSESDGENVSELAEDNITPASIFVEDGSITNIEVKETSQPILISSYQSYQREIHTSVLNGQSYMRSSKSAEAITFPPSAEIVTTNVMSNIEEKPILQTIPVNNLAPVSLNENITSHGQPYTINQSALALNDSPSTISIPNNQFCVSQSLPFCINQQLLPQGLTQNGIQVNSGMEHNGPNNVQASVLSNSNNLQTISINPSGSISISQLTQSQPNPISVNQMNQINEFPQTQPVTIHSLPYNNVGPILNMSGQNQFSINGKLMTNSVVQPINVPSTQWIQKVNKPAIAEKIIKSRVRSRTIAAKKSHFDENAITLPTSNQAPVIVQHLPSTNFVPFVDAYQQQAGTNVQYVTTISPQINSVSQPLVQIQPDNNIISIVPGLPSTMFIQQPRVVENQLVVDSNGTIGWSQVSQPPPVYYGFETIVQNTVMQSQQFLPTTVPGVLTANSSYSTTTQVFQTSKLEPVLDVTPNSFVLVNPGQLVTSQVEVPQYSCGQPTTIMASQPPTLVHSQSITPNHKNVSNSTSTSSINLPTAPFVSDQGIPMNIVTPIPKPVSQTRPMSRVLPMPTNVFKPPKIIDEKKTIIEDYIPDKPMQVKLEEIKFNFAKESNKLSELKIKPKKFEILDCKIIRPPRKIQDKGKLVEKKIKPSVKFDSIKQLDKAKFEIHHPVDNLKLREKSKPLLNINSTPIAVKNEVKFAPDNLFLPPVKEETVSLNTCAQIKSEDITEKPDLFKCEEEPKICTETKEEECLTDDPKIDSSLKLVFQKQGQDGTYKISSNVSKQPALIAPLRSLSSSKEVPIKQEVKNDDLSEPKIPLNKKTNDLPGSPSVLYTVNTQDGFKYSSNSMTECWSKVLEAVQNARAAHNMPPLPDTATKFMNSMQVLGVNSSHMKYLLEQLPGVSKCIKYKPLFNFTPNANDLELKSGHIFGAARCQNYENRNMESYDMFSWLSSRHRQPFNVSIDPQLIQSRRVNNLPLAMKFRNLKITSRWSVGVYRSSIHGRGLFCLREIEAGEMVIEYAGEVIRSVLTDKREKLYNSKGIGCYMFRVDDNFVVDATMKGNAARFINHSCDPNCYSKVVEILGHKHIVIFALRRITSGEELTYDYKFPFEEDKIPCTCGARRCRKFLN